VGVLNNVY